MHDIKTNERNTTQRPRNSGVQSQRNRRWRCLFTKDVWILGVQIDQIYQHKRDILFTITANIGFVGIAVMK